MECGISKGEGWGEGLGIKYEVWEYPRVNANSESLKTGN